MTCDHSPTVRLHVAMLGGPEHCPSCLAARLAEAESRLNLAEAEVTMLRHFNDEAEALLRKAYDSVVVDYQHYKLPEAEILCRRIDAFLKALEVGK